MVAPRLTGHPDSVSATTPECDARLGRTARAHGIPAAAFHRSVGCPGDCGFSLFGHGRCLLARDPLCYRLGLVAAPAERLSSRR